MLTLGETPDLAELPGPPLPAAPDPWPGDSFVAMAALARAERVARAKRVARPARVSGGAIAAFFVVLLFGGFILVMAALD